jgi:hypothetical protein
LLNGTLDEVRIWNTARTADEIRLNMAQALRGDEPGLVSYYRFDQDPTADQTTLYDHGPGGHDLTLTGMDPSSAWVDSFAFNTWIGGDSGDWAATGNWSRYATPGGADTAGVYAQPGGNDPTITSISVSLDDLVVADGATLSLVTGASLTASSRLFNYGRLQEARAVSGSSDVAFFDTGDYGGLRVNPNGDDLGTTTVTIDGNQDCTSTPGETIRRCFNISPTNAATTGAEITFFFADAELSGNDCTTLEAYHWNGTAWDPLTLDTTYGTDGRICEAEPRSVKVSGVTGFSPFTLKSPPLPTAITLTSFSARATTSGLNAAAIAGLLLVTLWGSATALRRFKADRPSL